MATVPSVALRRAHAMWRTMIVSPRNAPLVGAAVWTLLAIPAVTVLLLWWCLVTVWYTATLLLGGFSRIADYRESRRDSRRARLSRRQHREGLMANPPSTGVQLSSERVVIESTMSYLGAAKRLWVVCRTVAGSSSAATAVWIIGYPIVIPIAFLVYMLR